MATLDTSFYLAGLSFVLVVVYLSQSFNFEKLFLRVTAILPARLGGKSRKHQLPEKSDTTSFEAAKVKQTTPTAKYSPSWWTNEKIFQLERRAIFSKVYDLLRVYAPTQLILKLELAVCNPCFQIPETR
jgi:hypothetical protein